MAQTAGGTEMSVGIKALDGTEAASCGAVAAGGAEMADGSFSRWHRSDWWQGVAAR